MNKLLSLVVPVYFEEAVILQFIKETTIELEKLDYNYEIVFIDDGSTDETVSLIKNEAKENTKIKLLELSYNHGKQAAVTAGIHYAKGDYLLYMDPDLQDPPNEISKFVSKIEEGYDLVFGVRKEKKDTLKNKMFSKIFWGILEKFTGLKIPTGLAVMRIFNREFANRFIKYEEQNRFIEGLFMHIGMKQTSISIEQRERFAGVSKFNFKRKMELALDAIFDFSEKPLKMAIKIGLMFIFIGLSSLIIIVFSKLFFIDFQTGWASIISTIVFAMGIQLFFMGIIAIYIGKIYKESKSRPLFSIKDITNLK
jgi:dolichol-phosphate mannosyltransferase